MEFDNKGIKTVHISEYPVIVVYIIFVKTNVKAHLGLVLLLLYCICRVLTVRSAAPQAPLWGGPMPRFETGTGGL